MACSAAITSGAKNQPHKHLLIWSRHSSPFAFLTGCSIYQNAGAGFEPAKMNSFTISRFHDFQSMCPPDFSNYNTGKACVKSFLKRNLRIFRGFRRYGDRSFYGIISRKIWTQNILIKIVSFLS